MKKQLTLPVLFSQMDARWGSKLLGFNTDPKYNIYNYGCLITCLAMIAYYYGDKIDPNQVNELLKSVKGFSNGGFYNWGYIKKVVPQIEEEMWVGTPDPLTNDQMNAINSAIDAGYPVMIQIDYNPKTVEMETHYVVIVGRNTDDENDYLIADPLGAKLRSLKDYLGWFFPTARKTIGQYIIYKGKVPDNSTMDPDTIMKLIVPTKNFEGNVRSVEFYFHEWEVEKKGRATDEETYKKELKDLEDKDKKIIQDMADDFTQKSTEMKDQFELTLKERDESAAASIKKIREDYNYIIEQKDAKILELTNQPPVDVSTLPASRIFKIWLDKIFKQSKEVSK